MRRWLRFTPILILALAVTACSSKSATGPDEDNTNPSSSSSGALSFTYSGTQNGTFEAAGAINFVLEDVVGYGAGAFGAPTVDLIVGHGRLKNGNDISITIPKEATGGNYTFESDHCETGPGAKVLCVFVVIDLNNTIYFLRDGTFNVTQRTATRIKGTFTGESFEYDDNVGGYVKNLTVTNGSFDLPITIIKSTN